MELNWSTFVLEIINFLVLVWILKRFLYQPVLDVIAARRKAIEDQIAAAHAIEAEAKALKEQYTGRLSEWEAEKRKAKQALTHELDEERGRRLSDLESAIEREREKARVAASRQQVEQQRAVEQQALQQGAAFTSRLLSQAAGAELEDRLLRLVTEGLKNLPQEQLSRLRHQWADAGEIEVASAFDLSAAQRQQLSTALQAASGSTADVRFSRDETLIAGLNIVIGPWVLAANVRDELRGFTEFARAAH